MVEVVIKIPAIEKLLDYTASGVGGVAGPLLLPWRAYMEGKADRISARSYADVLPIITKAQDDARRSLVAPDAEVHGAVEITHEHLKQVIEFQGLKRLANIASVVESSAEDLGEKEVIDHEPDHDWTARFFDCVQDVSSEHMQSLWAKVLSGEVESPGRTSLRTLETLRNMTKQDADLFEELANCVIGSEFAFYYPDFVETLGAMKYKELLHLQDCGLINIGQSLGWTSIWADRDELVLPYQNSALVITRGQNALEKLELPAVLLTAAGKELYRIAQGEVQMVYLQDFSTFLQFRGCQLSFVKDVNPLPDDSFKFGERIPIEPRPIQPGMPAL
ncbi:MAG: DUF2806 domain-containing protein [Caldilineaceae bacterium]|nr:DUF2806 domain-containing protein [Caldilineaceae bacterium]